MPIPINKNLYELRILLVDDDGFMQTLIVQSLKSLDFNCISLASDGRQAIDLLNKKHYDLLISDIHMPYINGLELMKKIRMGETSAARDLRIIAITPFSNTEVLGSAIELDINGFLVKPVMQDAIFEKVKLAMNEPFKLQLNLEYQTINTELDSLKQETKIEPEYEADINTTENEQSTSIYVKELKANMRLYSDIKAKDDRLLLSTEKKLSEAIINRLIELESLIPHQRVLIKKHL